MGNTITLLGMGKAVYLRSDVSQWDFSQKEGITVFYVERDSLKPITFETSEKNAVLVKQEFSRDNLIEQYGRIFNS